MGLTPVPLSYSRHTSRFLTLYVFSLPFVMAPTLHLLTPVFTCLITWALSSIEEIGHFIEDPFNVVIREDDGEEVMNLTLDKYAVKESRLESSINKLPSKDKLNEKYNEN